MQLTIIFATVAALAMSVSAAPQPGPKTKDLTHETFLEGTIHSDMQCGSKNKIADWRLEATERNRCIEFEDIEGVGEFQAKTLKVNNVRFPNCAVYVYSDLGCHIDGRKLELGHCDQASNNFGFRSYYFYCG
ncbi:hypothetical protein FZEAL_3097 [Fusarium zealandicum]|uniref:Ricin B lectin domain-containing protein n=1 Tax=Fusarium zealandicum TaxID=1053134 RepID=A0A8H4UPK5_9HYPO|nr:hypothetical protein FZEAL_3097 [Fusarium zealandicum]